MNSGGSVYIVLNRDADRKFKVTRVARHPKYKGKQNNNGRDDPLSFSYDVGLLEVVEDVPLCFPTASKGELFDLKAGEKIGFIGFPMERLAKGGVDLRSPVAIMQSGIITAVSDFWQGDSRSEKNYLIRHNLGVTGGGSGSPIFNTDGEVVAILNAGNMAGQVVGKDKSGDVVTARTPSAVMINFAQRVDLLDEVVF